MVLECASAAKISGFANASARSCFLPHPDHQHAIERKYGVTLHTIYLLELWAAIARRDLGSVVHMLLGLVADEGWRDNHNYRWVCRMGERVRGAHCRTVSLVDSCSQSLRLQVWVEGPEVRLP